MKKNNKGFTLLEIMIAIAIIVLLIGVLIPIYFKYRENAKEAMDASNVKSRCDAIMIAAANGNADEVDRTVKLTQKKSGWQYDTVSVSLSFVSEVCGEPEGNGTAWIEYDEETGRTVVHFDDEPVPTASGIGVIN
ncbi:MAG: prepilin-type N-terminal cleavage/methylation domain-containing protein [Lachnospiraceae bacterium]|nr:prepilin-type N-terminal cleavage/methylation domain-containing protein [Lachnospiraceae bacterium]